MEMHNQYTIANQDKSQQITFKAAGGLFQRQATISNYFLTSIPDETAVNVWQM
jgi:hypothetical protein